MKHNHNQDQRLNIDPLIVNEPYDRVMQLN